MAAVSAGDFVLFSPDRARSHIPDHQVDEGALKQRYDMSSMDQQGYFLNQARTSFDFHSSVPSYLLGSSNCYQTPQFTLDPAKEPPGVLSHQPNPSASPSSFSQRYGDPPSVVSSASGASGQSTNSSADGSPHTHATHQLPYHDKWSGPLNGLGLGPDIVNHDPSGHGSYPVQEFDHEMILDENKYQDFVGEYQSPFPTVLLPRSMRALPPISRVSSKESSSAFRTSPSAPDNLGHSEDITIDSILEEMTGRSTASTQPRPTTSTATRSQTSPCSTKLSLGPSHSAVSPLPLTSAISLVSPPTAPLSHFAKRNFKVHDDLGRPIAPHGRTLFPFSPDLFFGQSSGRLITPLELSRSFSSKHSFPRARCRFVLSRYHRLGTCSEMLC